jgi:large subunit ribosomal protein L3
VFFLKALKEKTMSENATAENKPSIPLPRTRGGILGVKAGMTSVYDEHGNSIAVTIIDLKPCVVTQVKSLKKEGYQSVQVGFLPKKTSRATLPEQGHVRASGGQVFYHYQEFRLESDASLEGIEPGCTLSAAFLQAGDCVDVSAVNIGKGFQGGVKRYHMAGGNRSHGASLSHRQLGSIGNRADPGKCFKNKKMAGQMGNKHVTVQNLKVIRLDLENRVLLVNGSVPGSKSGIITIQKTVKR